MFSSPSQWLVWGKLKGTEFVNQIFRGSEFSFYSNFLLHRVFSSTPFSVRWELRFISSPQYLDDCALRHFLLKNEFIIICNYDWLIEFQLEFIEVVACLRCAHRIIFLRWFAIFILFCYLCARREESPKCKYSFKKLIRIDNDIYNGKWANKKTVRMAARDGSNNIIIFQIFCSHFCCAQFFPCHNLNSEQRENARNIFMRQYVLSHYFSFLPSFVRRWM